MIKVLITGPIMPPAGGISIHISRLQNLLDEEFEFDYVDESIQYKKDYYNIRSLSAILYLKKAIETDVFFIHSGNGFFKKMHILLAKFLNKKIIITIHGYRNRKNWIFRNIDKYIFELSDKIILVNEDILQRIHLNLNKKCIVKNAFLPPIMQNEVLHSNQLKKWITKSKSLNKIILCANASRLDTHNNEDLYGLDMCVEVTRRLIDNNFPVTLIFIVSSLDKGKNRFYHFIDLIKTLKLEDEILLIKENDSFVKIIEESDIVLRPTNTDGDAITVREAIYLGKTVLASDIVKRPEGTSLFKNRDFDDFELQLKKQINIVLQGKNITNERKNYNTKEYKEFYVKLIESTFFL